MPEAPPLEDPTERDINGLRVFVPGDDTFRLLMPGDPVFDCTASAASFALDLLGSQAGAQGLLSYTLKLVANERDVPALQGVPEADFELKVREFLSHIRRSFPHILVTGDYGMAHRNGLTHKRDHDGDFEPKRAAAIEISTTVCDPVRQQQRLNTTNTTSPTVVDGQNSWRPRKHSKLQC